MIERPGHPRDAYSWMDLFRAFAAAMVAISHIRDLMWRDALPGDGIGIALFYFLTGFGHTAVVIFFVLSGFWITRSTTKRLGEPRFWQSYLIDRLARLWVVLLPVLIIGGALDWYGAHILQSANYLGTSGAHSVSGPIGSRLGLPEVLGAPVFLSAVFVDPLGSNGPLWSLSYEFWYYIWFPVLALALARRRVSLLAPAFLLALFSEALALGFVSWLAGSVLHFGLRRVEDTRRRPWEIPVFALSFVATLTMLATSRIVQHIWLDPLLAVVFAVFLFGLCRVNLFFPPLLKPFARFGSLGSFSLYALHFPLAMVITGWLMGGARGEPSLALVAETSFVFVTVVVAAIAFSKLTEERTDQIRIATKRALGLTVAADPSAQVRKSE